MKKYKEAFLITPKDFVIKIEHRIEYMLKHPYNEVDLFYNGVIYTLWYKTNERYMDNKIGMLLIREFAGKKISTCVRGNCVLVKHGVFDDEKSIIKAAILNKKMDKTISLFRF